MGDQTPPSSTLSRLDQKIRAKELLESEIEDFWDSIWDAISQTAKKLNKNFDGQLNPIRNDHNTVIRVGAPIRAGTREKPSLEIRFKREECKLVTKYSTNPDVGSWENPVSFPIKADIEAEQLYLLQDALTLTPIQFAERMLAEKLMGINLNP